MRTTSCLALALASLALFGCTDDKDTADDTASAVDVFGETITVTTPAIGDFDCYTAGSAWIDETPDATCLADLPMAGEVEDFESGEPVPDATLEFWLADDPNGAVDITETGDAGGAISSSALPTCAPMTYRVTTAPELDTTKLTYEAHQVYGFPSDGVITDTFNSVSTTTFRVIPSLLGISIDPTAGIVAGTAYDCNGDEIEGAQVIVKDASGNYPEAQEIRYFLNDFPAPDQPHTSPDGLWVAINVPPGTVTVELWQVVGSGDPVLMGSTVLTVFADSINISSIYLGRDDGVAYPGSCLVSCDDTASTDTASTK